MGRRTMMRVGILKPFAGLLGLLFLAACTGPNSPGEACPEIAILNDAARLTKFGERGGRDFMDIQYEAALTSIGGKCRFDDDEAEVNLAFDVMVKRGAAMAGNELTLPYFVAVLRSDQRVVSKRNFTAKLRFGSGDKVLMDRISIRDVVAPHSKATGSAYEVVVGIQLNSAELSYNQRNSRN